MSSEELIDPGPKPELKWIDVDLIDVDRNYQRDLRPVKVATILKKFTWAEFGAVILAEKGDGRFNCYDGQHRTEAAKLHPAIDAVPASVYRFESFRDEAAAFLAVNVNRSAVSTIERYHAGLEAGDEKMMAVCAAVEEAGCQVAAVHGDTAPNKTHAVTAVSRAIQYFGHEAVVAALESIRAGWPNERMALKGTIIEALARIISQNESMDKDRLVSVLRGRSPTQFSADAEAMKRISGGSPGLNLTRVLVASYNKGLSSSTIAIGAAGR
ncbi:MAG: hypothetical protein JJ891_16870 [Rhizobiaceae bacterium]|nr:hypothetical protein [Rhizobiaceae bacterium]